MKRRRVDAAEFHEHMPFAGFICSPLRRDSDELTTALPVVFEASSADVVFDEVQLQQLGTSAPASGGQNIEGKAELLCCSLMIEKQASG